MFKTQKTALAKSAVPAAVALSITCLAGGCHNASGGGGSGESGADTAAAERAAVLVQEGQAVFRFDTLGSEAFWGDTLGVHLTVAGAALGGVGPGVGPATALAVGLKVDEAALTPGLRTGLAAGTVDLTDPANTVGLLQLNAVVGLKGTFNNGLLTNIGITCALCHSTVDDSFAPGIGRRLDGWPNRDLNVGAVVGLASDLSHFQNLLNVDEATVRTVLESWGPGRFDAHLNLDGKVFQPNGDTSAVLLPAAYGLGGVNLATYTGWGSVPHWNGFVGNFEMGGQGRFFDPRLNDAVKFPLAAAHGLADVNPAVDRISGVAEALQLYQLSLPIPVAPPGSFDEAAAARGEILFSDKADCARCHTPPFFTEPGWNLHTPAEMGIDDFHAMRSPTEHYRTTPLRGLSARLQGGLYHDGQFPTLVELVEHYDQWFTLLLTNSEKADLIEYLKSL